MIHGTVKLNIPATHATTSQAAFAGYSINVTILSVVVVVVVVVCGITTNTVAVPCTPPLSVAKTVNRKLWPYPKVLSDVLRYTSPLDCMPKVSLPIEDWSMLYVNVPKVTVLTY